ncbi:CDP-diacylglycerol diphosphatase [Mycobacterium sp. 2YAF39]|uniref:CDP-diacylglycerol diphosphatase n=1 Tax=Mycobacterium sp. 2YAF39 TaxID=3233033 RepID=UPI003F9A58FA
MAWTRALILAVSILLATNGLAGADPDVLWRIVNDQCVPHEQASDDPAPCALVNQGSGVALLKDIDGPAQYLLIPTARISGIESPELLAPDATNYFAEAWQERSLVDDRLGRSVPRDWMSLAINSEFARSQNQLHIHIDCLRADVHDAVLRHVADIGPTWASFPEPLAGDPYSAMAVAGDDLGAANPFDLLADGLPGARADMARRTLVVVGAILGDGRPGFIVLAGLVDPATGDTGGGEAVQDHQVCAAPVVGK